MLTAQGDEEYGPRLCLRLLDDEGLVTMSSEGQLVESACESTCLLSRPLGEFPAHAVLYAVAVAPGVPTFRLKERAAALTLFSRVNRAYIERIDRLSLIGFGKACRTPGASEPQIRDAAARIVAAAALSLLAAQIAAAAALALERSWDASFLSHLIWIIRANQM